MSTLFTWLGDQDREAFSSKKPNGGPIPSMLSEREFTSVVVLTNWDNEAPQNTNTAKQNGKNAANRTKINSQKCREWFETLTQAEVSLEFVDIPDPTDLGKVYTACFQTVKNFAGQDDLDPGLFFNISSGTWAMSLVWSFISKTSIYSAELLSSSKETGPRIVNFPFEVDAQYISDQLKKEVVSERGSTFDTVLLKDNSFYSNIAFKSDSMKKLKYDVIIAAAHSLPVFINGALGTEKEVLAKYIHENDPNCDGKFVSLFCGSDYPFETERRLFGDSAEVFYGKPNDSTKGVPFVKEAEFGTLYLEDVEKLSTVSQSLLLKLIEQAEAEKLQNPKQKSRSARIIASSNIDLFEATQKGLFSEQLFFKLSAAIIRIPNLSERGEDIVKIATSMLDNVNKMRSFDENYGQKEFSPAALNSIRNKRWLGNLFELDATVKRAALQSSGTVITEEDISNASLIFPQQETNNDNVLNKKLGDGFDLRLEIEKVARHYLLRAMEQSGNNRAKASALVGIKNYQTFTNWIVKYVENSSSS